MPVPQNEQLSVLVGIPRASLSFIGSISFKPRPPPPRRPSRTPRSRSCGATSPGTVDRLIFIFVGMVPRTELLKDVLPLDKGGCVETDDSMATAIPGLYVAGDIRAKRFRQITTAVADGTIAALAVQKFLRENR